MIHIPDARTPGQRSRRERDARIVYRLLLGFSIRDVAGAFQLSPSRVSAIKCEWLDDEQETSAHEFSCVVEVISCGVPLSKKRARRPVTL